MDEEVKTQLMMEINDRLKEICDGIHPSWETTDDIDNDKNADEEGDEEEGCDDVNPFDYPINPFHVQQANITPLQHDLEILCIHSCKPSLGCEDVDAVMGETHQKIFCPHPGCIGFYWLPSNPSHFSRYKRHVKKHGVKVTGTSWRRCKLWVEGFPLHLVLARYRPCYVGEGVEWLNWCVQKPYRPIDEFFSTPPPHPIVKGIQQSRGSEEHDFTPSLITTRTQNIPLSQEFKTFLLGENT